MDAGGYEVADLNTGLIAINRHWLDANPNVHWAGNGPASYVTRTQEEVDANARLISAAPDLLEAALFATNAAQSLEWDDLAQQAFDRLRAAITKATEPKP